MADCKKREKKAHTQHIQSCASVSDLNTGKKSLLHCVSSSSMHHTFKRIDNFSCYINFPISQSSNRQEIIVFFLLGLLDVFWLLGLHQSHEYLCIHYDVSVLYYNAHCLLTIFIIQRHRKVSLHEIARILMFSLNLVFLCLFCC